MPFGFTNAPSTFQAVMNDLFSSFLHRFVLVFFDEYTCIQPLLVFSFSASNGGFAVDYLGHVISWTGVLVDLSKLRAIADWTPPNSLTALRAFLGLTGYYRRFFQQYATIAGPLTDLLKAETASAAPP
ncbi:Retrovirus-related Pol polyprotein from transposon [Sesamum alatum]|uniref:Retrovirus-related Pol polyprotein from transposon n=1 Tax=Sesamum alatum TaxID=300844 RepID=A0AAE2CNF6_9LAMI|nr:Retrovirus-related Pol polyprotein from transposon [Sesamum alatum]